jgi:hypothetical protein
MGRSAFGDIGEISILLVLFLELFSAGIAFTILFADSCNILFGADIIHLKIIFGILMTPSTFASIRGLGIISYVGFLGFLYLIMIVVFDGGFGDYVPAHTNLWSNSVSDVGLALGLIFVGLDMHAMVPGIFKAMRNPGDFRKGKFTLFKVFQLALLLFSVDGF